MSFLRLLVEYQHYAIAAAGFCLAVIASGHAVLNKRDSQAAVLWVGVIWLAPVIGPVLYVLLGINRIERKAVSLWSGYELTGGHGTDHRLSTEEITAGLTEEGRHLNLLMTLVNGIASRPLVRGNKIKALEGGDEAFPAMLEAIEAARDSINLATYIFDWDRSGREFAEALGRAVQRGIKVRVLIDDAGGRYSRRSTAEELSRRGVKCRRFLRTLNPLNMMGLNLRNHRKIMIVDGRHGFMGGMNIREGCRLSMNPRSPVRDLHFQVEGPVLAQMQEAFADDWFFTTGESMSDPRWYPDLMSDGTVVARGISDGPDAELRRIQWVMVGALNAARRSVKIVTPYFLPNEVLVSALNQAARRGVNVDVILPAKSNLPFVQWAMTAGYWKLLTHGVRIWATPSPFDHTKLLVVDGNWSLIGSSNWDPRSLRLNFEFNLECYDGELAARLERIADEKIATAEAVTLGDVDGRSFVIRLRDGIARLATPLL
ncbi:MAG: cardiolipin synthase [Verrucomicrobiae bacterium]|jgi:cardiolipin synthase|nr:cardiolipin synthase [Verrucomicrobiae bacterium]